MDWKAETAEFIENIEDVPGHAGSECAALPDVTVNVDMPEFEDFEKRCLKKDECAPDWNEYRTTYRSFTTNDVELYAEEINKLLLA
jgi:hypothetical protein